jgi:hypothetical protein
MDKEAYLIGLIYKHLREGISEGSHPNIIIGKVLIGPKNEDDSKLVKILNLKGGLNENQAIVEAGVQYAPLCGSGGIYFLEKKFNEWEIGDYIPTWIS